VWGGTAVVEGADAVVVAIQLGQGERAARGRTIVATPLDDLPNHLDGGPGGPGDQGEGGELDLSQAPARTGEGRVEPEADLICHLTSPPRVNVVLPYEASGWPLKTSRWNCKRPSPCPRRVSRSRPPPTSTWNGPKDPPTRTSAS
jgi:hypothetical protein